jgi:hypothetical protein
MQSWRTINDQPLLEFDATLVLERENITAEALKKLIWQYPFMTMKVVLAIYWQALKLFIKRVPVYDHPEKAKK